MNMSHFFRFAAAFFILAPAAVFFTGCGTPCSGTSEVPVLWGELGFKVVEGGTVCAYSDKQISVDHGGFEIPDLFEKYKQELTAAGWQVSELQRPALVTNATKDTEEFTIRFGECDKSLTRPSTWSKCTDASIIRKEQKKP